MTKIYKTQTEINADIKDGILEYDGDIIIKFSHAVIKADISVENITAYNIIAKNIDAMDINVSDIKAKNINARDINAWNIKAEDIAASNIDAWNIDAKNIIYFAVCFAIETFICNSIRGRRKNHKHFCLDSEIIIKGEQP